MSAPLLCTVTDRPDAATCAIRARILARASDTGGAHRHELTNKLFEYKKCADVRRILDEMVAAGELHRFARPTGGQPMQRYFTHKHMGEHWAAANFTRWKPKPGYKPVPLTLTPKKDKAAARAPTAKVIVPKGVKVTVLPSAPVYARHQLPPGAVVPSVVNPAECRAWAREVA